MFARLLIALLISSNCLAAEVTILDLDVGKFLIDGKECSVDELLSCKNELGNTELEQMLYITETAIKRVNSKFNFKTTKEWYYHYLATIYTAHFYYFYAYGRNYQLWDVNWLYEITSKGFTKRFYHKFGALIWPFLERKFPPGSSIISVDSTSKDWRDSIYEDAFDKAVQGDFLNREKISQEKKRKALNLRITGNSLIDFIANEGDRDQLVKLMTFNLQEMWTNVHNEIMDKLIKYQASSGIEYLQFPLEYRCNIYLKPFISAITIEEERLKKLLTNTTPQM